MISTAAAILGSAVIGGVGSAIASGNNSKAINTATQAQTQSNAENVALQRDVYNQNKTALQPWQSGGLAAFNMNNAMLGISPTVEQNQQVMPNVLAQFYPAGGFEDYSYGGAFGDATGPYRGQVPNWQNIGAPMQPQTTTGPQGNPWDGFKNWLAGSDYAFQLDRGANKINSGYAAGGVLQSGAAMRALEEYRQNLQKGYRGEYQDRVTNQQNVGLGAASAQAGVGQTFANNVTSLNSQNADTLAQLAMARANNSNGLVNSLATLGSGALGRIAG